MNRYCVRLTPVKPTGNLSFVLVIVNAASEQDAIETAIESMQNPDQYVVTETEYMGEA